MSAATTTRTAAVHDGPYAEDLAHGIGRPLPSAPAVTLDAGLAAAYQAIVGDVAPLPRSAALCERVTGSRQRLVDPGLVLNLVVGQSTVATRRVVANLSYRDVRLLRPLRFGETIETTVTPLSVDYTRTAGAPRRGKVLLDIVAHDEHGDTVARMQRLALVPARGGDDTGISLSDDARAGTGSRPHDPSPLAGFAGCVPASWDLTGMAADAAPPVGWRRTDATRDVVTGAPELARLTMNQAFAHRDPAHGQQGRTLVYGGHVIGLAQASLTRLVPGLVSLCGWDFCEHRAPVFERDVLSFDVECVERCPREPGGALLRLLVRARAGRADRPDTEAVPVLHWQAVVLVAR